MTVHDWKEMTFDDLLYLADAIGVNPDGAKSEAELRTRLLNDAE